MHYSEAVMRISRITSLELNLFMIISFALGRILVAVKSVQKSCFLQFPSHTLQYFDGNLKGIHLILLKGKTVFLKIMILRLTGCLKSMFSFLNRRSSFVSVVFKFKAID